MLATPETIEIMSTKRIQERVGFNQDVIRSEIQAVSDGAVAEDVFADWAAESQGQRSEVGISEFRSESVNRKLSDCGHEEVRRKKDDSRR